MKLSGITDRYFEQRPFEIGNTDFKWCPDGRREKLSEAGKMLKQF